MQMDGYTDMLKKLDYSPIPESQWLPIQKMPGHIKVANLMRKYEDGSAEAATHCRRVGESNCLWDLPPFPRRKGEPAMFNNPTHWHVMADTPISPPIV